MSKPKKRILNAIELAFRYGEIDGDHHKMWVIDQMLRALLENEYEKVIEKENAQRLLDDCFSWETGVAP